MSTHFKRKAEFVRPGSCPTRKLSNKIGVIPVQVTDRKLSHTESHRQEVV